jgi:hypothetical protein
LYFCTSKASKPSTYLRARSTSHTPA